MATAKPGLSEWFHKGPCRSLLQPSSTTCLQTGSAWSAAPDSRLCGMVRTSQSCTAGSPLYTPWALHQSHSWSCDIGGVSPEQPALPSPGSSPTAWPQRSGPPGFSWWPSRVAPPPAPGSGSRWRSLNQPKTHDFVRKTPKPHTLSRGPASTSSVGSYATTVKAISAASQRPNWSRDGHYGHKSGKDGLYDSRIPPPVFWLSPIMKACDPQWQGPHVTHAAMASSCEPAGANSPTRTH